MLSSLRITVVGCLCLLLPLAAMAFAPGELDSGFNTGTGASDYVFAAAVQIDGKILIAGVFTDIDGTATNRIARLLPDGSLDSGFNSGTGADGQINIVAVQGDGKIVIGGWFTTINGVARRGIARLNNDGSLDTTFNPFLGAYPVHALSLQADGKIIVAGNFDAGMHIDLRFIRRLNSDGSLDDTFDVDTGDSGSVTSVVLQNDGKLIIFGSFTNVNGVARAGMARINDDGSLDATFNIGTGVNRTRTMVMQSDGKIIIGGGFTSVSGVTRNKIARLNSDGSLDTTFNSILPSNFDVFSIVLQGDGKVIIGGVFGVQRLNSDGSLDATFNSNFNDWVWTLALQADGKVVIGGSFTAVNGVEQNYIARLHSGDTDSDGIEDAADAFPNDPAAALDTDHDGQPDSFLLLQFEGFEAAAFPALPGSWSGSATLGALPHSGSNAASLLDGQILQAPSGVTGNYISFWHSGADRFYFYIDGVLQAELGSSDGGLYTWAQYTQAVTPGNHVLRWVTNTYTNENCGGSGQSTCSEIYVSIGIDDVDFGNPVSPLVVDLDDDNDGVPDVNDAFPRDPTETLDNDSDGIGDKADTDDDNDGVLDGVDNCPLNANSNQLDTDGGGTGDICDIDDDNDGVPDISDKFPLNAAVSVDSDLDGYPDAWDTACNAECQLASGMTLDNCPLNWNADQLNIDGDTQGDICDTDNDNDGVPEGGVLLYASAFNGANLGWDFGKWSILHVTQLDVGHYYVASQALCLGDGCQTPFTMTFTYTAPQPVIVTFWATSSTATDTSDLSFLVDGVLAANDTYNSSAYKKTSVVVGAGNHVFTWTAPDSDPRFSIRDVSITTVLDNCPLVANADQLDGDGDGIGNACDTKPKNDYNNDGIAGWTWKGVGNGNETASQNWQLTFPFYSNNWAIPNRFYHPVFADQANWEMVTSGDFNKDGDADILWRNNTTAQWKVWQMQSGLRSTQNNFADFDLSHEWTVIGAGDTDKDGDDDVILNNVTTGEVIIWQMQSHAVVATYAVGSKAGYTLNRIGDFNKDGDVDLLFRQAGGDALITWEIESNAFVTERALANTGTNYNPVCAADFDKDGDDDIMLINSTTQQEKWLVMENYIRTQKFGGTNTGFSFLGCGDYDGDGDADSLWKRDSDELTRVVLQQNWGTTKQTVYTNAFGGANGFVYRGNSN